MPNVYRIDCPFGDGGVVYVYYIDAPEPALVDTGVNYSVAGQIQPALAAAGFSLADVRHIFNTHGHWDHMGGNERARAVATQARTHIHRNDLSLLDSLDNHTNGYTCYPARLMGDPALVEAQRVMLGSSINCPTPADVLVDDGQLVDLGGGLCVRVVFTPGHSLGSCSYLLEPLGALFTGDGVQGLGSRPGQLPLVFEDSQAYRATIARLAEVPMAALCMGHAFCGLSPDSGRDPVRQSAAAQLYLEESGEAAKAVEEAMRSAMRGRGPQPFLDVARAALAALRQPLGVEVDASGLSFRSLATLHAFYREITGAPCPVG